MNAPAIHRAAIHFFVPLAAFMAGWSLRTAAPEESASAPKRTADLRPDTLRAGTKTKASHTADANVSTLANRPGPAGRMAALLLNAETLDAPGTLAALKSLDLQPPGTDTRTARQILLARYADLDPETALTYVDTLPDADRTASSLTIMNAWAARDPRAAAAHLEANAGSFGLSEEDAALSAAGIASTWAAQDMPSAVQWVAGLSDDMRAAAIPALAGTLAASNPAAATVMVTGLTDSAEQTAAAASVANQWAQAQPRATAAWVSSLTNSQTQSAAAASLITAWMQTDPAAASQWVNALPSSAARDAAIASLTESPAIRNDAESAVAWASAIKDPTLRESILPAAVRRWQYQQLGVTAGH
jgi:hypothetical protein